MLDCLKKDEVKLSGLFAAGVVFGTAGIKILTSSDAKNVYTKCTAAVLRAKECVMNTVSHLQENAGDIYEGAKIINEERNLAEEDFFGEDEDFDAEVEIDSDETDEVPTEA